MKLLKILRQIHDLATFDSKSCNCRNIFNIFISADLGAVPQLPRGGPQDLWRNENIENIATGTQFGTICNENIENIATDTRFSNI